MDGPLFPQTGRSPGDGAESASAAAAHQSPATVAVRPQACEFQVTVSPGEYYDRRLILEVKFRETGDDQVFQQTVRWAGFLQPAHALSGELQARLDDYLARLKALHQRLWHVEDELRLALQTDPDGPGFRQLAQQVPLLNDERAMLKSHINALYRYGDSERKIYPSVPS